MQIRSLEIPLKTDIVSCQQLNPIAFYAKNRNPRVCGFGADANPMHTRTHINSDERTAKKNYKIAKEDQSRN